MCSCNRSRDIQRRHRAAESVLHHREFKTLENTFRRSLAPRRSESRGTGAAFGLTPGIPACFTSAVRVENVRNCAVPSGSRKCEAVDCIRNPMAHRLISAVMLVLLILQGVTLAAADVVPTEASHSMVHCVGHEDAGADCACCGGSDMMGIHCAAQCSTAGCASMPLLAFSFEKVAQVSIVSDAWIAGPAYSPPNPPPIA
jgi:hypothetical protein